MPKTPEERRADDRARYRADKEKQKAVPKSLLTTRGGFRMREDAENLLARIVEDAGQHITATIEENRWHAHYIRVTLKKKRLSVAIHSYRIWAEYWGAWQVLLEPKEGEKGA